MFCENTVCDCNSDEARVLVQCLMSYPRIFYQEGRSVNNSLHYPLGPQDPAKASRFIAVLLINARMVSVLYHTHSQCLQRFGQNSMLSYPLSHHNMAYILIPLRNDS